MSTPSKRSKAKARVTHRVTRYAVIPIHRNGRAAYIPSKPIKTRKRIPASQIAA